MIDINLARKWIDTPFITGGTTIYGCDCIGLIVGILKEQGICIDLKEYKELGSYDHLNLDLVMTLINKYCFKINYKDLQVGDLAFFTIKTNVAHFGIISSIGETQSIIHANQSCGKVVETIYDNIWKKQFLSYFRVNSFYKLDC